MKNPREVKEIIKGATYMLPVYEVTNDGIADGTGANEDMFINFCKGNKNDEAVYRSPGIFTESLLQTCKMYLESVNVDGMKTEETTNAISSIESAMNWLNKRAMDRKQREVQGTYEK